MLNILARMIFKLIPVACPKHFAIGDGYTLLKILREAPERGDLILFNQDLAGFFASIDIDEARFLAAWYMLLDLSLRPHIDVGDSELSLFGLPGEIKQSWEPDQRPHLPEAQRHKKDRD